MSSSDSAFLFLFKTLLHPLLSSGPVLVVALTLQPGTIGSYFLLAALTFLITNVVLDIAIVRLSDESRTGWLDFFDICLRWCVISGLVLGILYVSDILISLNARILKYWLIGTPVLLWTALFVAQAMLTKVWAKRSSLRKAIIVGAGDVGLRLEGILRYNPALRTELQGFFEDRDPGRIAAEASGRIIGKCGDLVDYIQRTGTDIVYITIPMSRQQRILDLLSQLNDSTASIYFVPDLLTFNLIQARIDTLEGLPLIAVCESPFLGVSGLVKRVMDMFLAFGMIVVALPIFLLVALGVRRSSPGPIILRQTRYGLDGKPIGVYKFRSMAVTEDGQNQYKQVTRDDPRVTQFGALIRRTSLDELPQLFNVLEGSMSLVGPRPHVVAVNEAYRKLIPGYMIRHKVRPGITGLAQINGYRGGDDIESMRGRIEYDLRYLRGWSVSLDISILMKTAQMVLSDKKAF